MVVSGFTRLFSALVFSALALPSLSVAAEACNVTIHFGSYCCGIDSKAHQRIIEYLRRSQEVQDFTELPLPPAREGEIELCIVTEGLGAARRVFDQTASIIPQESQRAWTEVRLPGGAHFRTQWPGVHR